MRSIEKSAKVVDDAIKSALTELKCDLADVQIDILDAGSPGLFGMFGRLAKVRVTVKEEEKLDLDMPVFSLNAQAEPAPKREKPKQEKKPPQPEKPKQEKAPKPESKPAPEMPVPEVKAEPTPKPERIDKPRNEARAPKQPPMQPREKRPEASRSHKSSDHTPVRIVARDLPPLEVENLGELGKVTYEFLSDVTKLMDVPVEIRIEESEDHIEAQMIGDTLGVLIGRRGDTLDALQYLTSLQVNKGREKYVRVTLDTNHYRAKRADALTKLASRMATRAVKTGHRVALEPMNPYERRILHSALQGHPDVTTHSEGEEPYRRVVITLK